MIRPSKKKRPALFAVGLALFLVVGASFWLARIPPAAPRRGGRAARPATARAVASNSVRQANSPSREATAEFALFGRPYPVLASRSSPPDARGVSMREWLLQTAERFGPIRVEEHVRRDATGNDEIVVTREAFVAGEILVRPREGVTQEVFTAVLAQADAVSWRPVFGSTYWIVRFSSPDLDTKPRALAALAGVAAIAAVEGNGLGTTCAAPDDPRFPEQYSLENTGQGGGRPGADIRMTQAWEICRTSPDVIVAVLDVGINYDHPDLAENIYRDPRELPANGIDDDGNGFVDDWRGWNFADNNNDPGPSGDHGTGAASVIGARGNNGRAIAGITWEVQLLPVKVSNGTGTTANLVAGINYARTKGARIMSLSLGGFPYSAATLEAIEAARAADILMVIAAGNGGTDNDVAPFYPASYPSENILSVANTNNLDELNLSLSNFGLRSVDLGAPGTQILGLSLGDGYRYGNGTSSATPHVAGVAALLRQMRPAATVAELKRWILDTVDPLPTLAGRCVSGGRLNAYAALRAAQVLPAIAVQPLSRTVAAGGAVELLVVASSPLALNYQWWREGQPVAGATGPTLSISILTAAQAGDYTVVVSNSTGAVTSRLARLVAAAPDPGRLINLSVRATAGAGGQPLIVGFAVRGGAKRLLVRAVGPSLGTLFGVPGALADPRLDLHETVGAEDRIVASNDNWGATAAECDALTAACALVSAFPLATTSRDAALTLDVDGARTVHALGVPSSASGVVLVEAYDAGAGNATRLVNVSTRNHVGTGNDVLIAGFVLNGNMPKRLLVRGVGPSLATLFGVANALADSRLELHTTINGRDTIVATNDNWVDEPGAVEAAESVGAFALPTGSKDAALVVTLPAGSYTAVLAGVDGATGNGLIEVYEVP